MELQVANPTAKEATTQDQHKITLTQSDTKYFDDNGNPYRWCWAPDPGTGFLPTDEIVFDWDSDLYVNLWLIGNQPSGSNYIFYTSWNEADSQYTGSGYTGSSALGNGTNDPNGEYLYYGILTKTNEAPALPGIGQGLLDRWAYDAPEFDGILRSTPPKILVDTSGNVEILVPIEGTTFNKDADGNITLDLNGSVPGAAPADHHWLLDDALIFTEPKGQVNVSASVGQHTVTLRNALNHNQKKSVTMHVIVP